MFMDVYGINHRLPSKMGSIAIWLRPSWIWSLRTPSCSREQVLGKQGTKSDIRFEPQFHSISIHLRPRVSSKDRWHRWLVISNPFTLFTAWRWLAQASCARWIHSSIILIPQYPLDIWPPWMSMDSRPSVAEATCGFRVYEPTEPQGTFPPLRISGLLGSCRISIATCGENHPQKWGFKMFSPANIYSKGERR